MIAHRAVLTALVLLATVPAGADDRSIASAIAHWPEKARLLAEAALQEYGRPDEFRADQLTWLRRRPWTRITVYRESDPTEDPNNLLQSLAYEVSPRRWRDLSAFERGVTYDPLRKELIARGGSEQANLLALNLADEIIEGRRTPAEATEFYDRTWNEARSGKSSSYMFRLMFSPVLREAARRQRGLNEDLEREVRSLDERN